MNNSRLGKGIGALINSQNLDKGEYLDGFIEVDRIKTNSKRWGDRFCVQESVEEMILRWGPEFRVNILIIFQKNIVGL